jgi:hypothetical protein
VAATNAIFTCTASENSFYYIDNANKLYRVADDRAITFICDNAKSVAASETAAYVVLQNGESYSVAQDGLVPVFNKLTSNAESVYAGKYAGAAIKKDASVWIWGSITKDRYHKYSIEDKRMIFENGKKVVISDADDDKGQIYVLLHNGELWSVRPEPIDEDMILHKYKLIFEKLYDDVEDFEFGRYYHSNHGVLLRAGGKLYGFGIGRDGSIGDNEEESDGARYICDRALGVSAGRFFTMIIRDMED